MGMSRNRAYRIFFERREIMNNKQNFPDNILYEMDNLEVLRGLNSETIDLIATDPPYGTSYI